ncbi:MAG: hypothetical protein AAF487_04715 [Bacteroidota bacterium]
MKNLSILLTICLLAISSCTKDSGTLTLQFTKATAVYGNIDDVRSEALIEEAKSIQNPGKIFVGIDVLLIGEENEGIHVYDNSNPSFPQSVLFINLPFTKEFYVEDDIIYAESHYDMVKINIQDMNNPILDSRLEYALSSPLVNDQGQTLLGFHYEQVSESFDIGSQENEMLSSSDRLYYDYRENLIPPSAVPASFAGNGDGQAGSVNRIVKHGNYVYALSFSKIHTFEDSPSGLMSSNNTTSSFGTQMETIYPLDDKLFVGTRNSVQIYDISSPQSPYYLSEFSHPTSCDPVLPYEDVAYTTLRTGDFSNCPGDVNSLLTLDISNPSSPIDLHEIEMESPYGMTIYNGFLYVGEGENGMKIFDISDRAEPLQVSFDQSVEAYDIIVHPTIEGLILTAGPSGIEQYTMNPSTFDLALISAIDY